MARYFDSILGERDDGVLNTFNHDSFIENSLDNLPVYTPSESMPADYLSQAGFVPNPDPNNQGTYVAPSRALTEHYARKEGIRQQNLQRQMESTRDSTMFKIGDTLADTGRLFLSPLFWLSGEDTTKYDPSARIEAGYKQQMVASESYRRGMYEKLLTARDARQQQSIALRQRAYENSLPQSSQAKELYDYALRTGPENQALYNQKTPEAFDALNKQMMLATDNAIPLTGSDGSQIIIPKNRNETFNKYGTRFEQSVAPASEAFQALDKLRSALRQGTPLSEVAAVTQFNKVLDPGSVVRESEVKLTSEARSVWASAKVRLKDLAEGDILTDDQVIDMLALSDDLEAVYVDIYNQIRDDAEFKFTNLGYGDNNVIRQYLGTRKQFNQSQTPTNNTITVPDLSQSNSGGPLRSGFTGNAELSETDLLQNDLQKYLK